MSLTNEQQQAVSSIHNFLQDPSAKFFLLQGFAGTGKTYTLHHIVQEVEGRMVFTAPTNKATKVIRDSFQDSDYFPECRTIYSLLGLRLQPNGEVKELTYPEDPLDLSRFLAVVVDEASMINSNLWKYIAQTSKEQKVKFIFMGDPAQLPPVKEPHSPVWGLEDREVLSKVMRHDNQILTLATSIRKVVDHPAPCINLASDNDGQEGVWRINSFDFDQKILDYTDLGYFSKPNKAKAIAWRNKTVDKLNALIRNRLFPSSDLWVRGDRLILVEPVKDLKRDQLIAYTDDEGTVERVEVDRHPIYSELQCYHLTVTLDDNRTIPVITIHPSSLLGFQTMKNELLLQAKGNGRFWRDYWAFMESFNQVKYAYAITAHRSQGSTYEIAFVEAMDVLQNRNRQEAFRCLYVACTRPKKQLYLT